MCTRVLYQGTENVVLTARSCDWNEGMSIEIVILPRNVNYTSHLGKNPISWTSKHGSIVAFAYYMGTGDGINEKGLVANLLYLAESDYSSNPKSQDLSILQWAQFTLDLFGTVAEAVTFYQSTPINILPGTFPNGRSTSLHLSLSDASGDSAILEYIDGKLVIHHSRDYTVMTNSPQYEEQLALCRYWKDINGMVFLPGSISAADRFVRASFLLNAIPKTVDKNYISTLADQSYQQQALASILGVIRSVGVPLGIQDPNKPNISSTIWRTVSDHKNLVYYFDSATSPSIFWIDMKEIDFSTLKSTMSLPNAQNHIYAGDTLSQFIEYQMPTL